MGPCRGKPNPGPSYPPRPPVRQVTPEGSVSGSVDGWTSDGQGQGCLCGSSAQQRSPGGSSSDSASAGSSAGSSAACESRTGDFAAAVAPHSNIVDATSLGVMGDRIRWRRRHKVASRAGHCAGQW
jgi:hypothetical protein